MNFRKKTTDYRLIFGGILLVGLLLRLYRIDLGLLVTSPNRQLIDAVYARNIYRGVWLTDQILGMQIYHWLVAGLYVLTGGVHEICGHLLSVFFSMLGAIYFYRLLKIYLKEREAILGLFFFYVLSPMEIIMSRAFQVDSMNLFLGIFAIYCLVQWRKSTKASYLFLAGLSFTFCLLIKITFIYFGLPLLVVFWEKFSKRTLRQWQVYVFFILTLIPVIIWYEFARQANLRFSPVDGLIRDWNLFGWFMVERLWQPKFYVNMFYYWVQSVVTPIGAVLVVMVWLQRWSKQHLLFYSWFIAGWLSMVYQSNPALTHEYYILALAAPSTVLAGIGLNCLIDWSAIKKWRAPNLGLIFIAVVAILSTWRTYALEIYRISPRHKMVLLTAQKTQALIPQKVAIIATSYNSSVLWYYADRPGDYLRIIAEDETAQPNQTIQLFETMRKKTDASYYVISDVNELQRNKEFSDYLKRFKLLNPENQHLFRIYKLN